MAAPFIHVAAAAIEDDEGRVLITRRPDHVHQGGLWEFPGGKLEPGETAEQGLARELLEELGIQVLSSRSLIRVHHDYGDRQVLLDVYRVDAFSGEPRGLEGQPLSWRHPRDMDGTRFPPADRPIIMALRLPQLYLITGPDPRDSSAFLGRLAAAIRRGVRLVQLRAHDLGDAEYARLACAAFELCEGGGAKLLLNRDPASVRGLPCHGLHLGGRSLASLEGRPEGEDRWIGASCHDAGELERAAALGLDYVLLSPVKPTASHPGAPALGWERFAALAERVCLPVYALGGLTPQDLNLAISHGAQGIAAIHGLWSE